MTERDDAPAARVCGPRRRSASFPRSNPGNTWQALAELVRKRRAALWFRQADLATNAGISEGTVKNIEQGARSHYSVRTLIRLEQGLLWEPGTIDTIISGNMPSDMTPPCDAVGTVSTAMDEWVELGRQVKQRRKEMRLAQADLAQRGGPGELTVRRIERGEANKLRNGTKSQLETALSVRPGWVDRILTGEATDEAQNPDPWESIADTIETEDQRLQADELVSRSTLPTTWRAWSKEEAAGILGVPVDEISAAIRRRELPAVHIGQYLRIADSALRQFAGQQHG